MDAAYANKVELQAKVDSMDQEIKFFKCLYEAVSLCLPPAPKGSQWAKLCSRGWERLPALRAIPLLGIHLPFQPREAPNLHPLGGKEMVRVLASQW